MNAGGLNLSFQLKSDLQAAAYIIFLNSFQWYPLMGFIGLCFAPDYVSMVQLVDGKLEKVEPILSVPKEMLRKHGYSVLSKEIKQDELEGYI